MPGGRSGPGSWWGRSWWWFALLLSTACGFGRDPAPGIGQQFSPWIEQVLHQADLPAASGAPAARQAYWRQNLERFYLLRRYQPAWVGPHGALRQADDLLAVLAQGAAHGLPGDLYRLTQLKLAVRASRLGGSLSMLARLDVWLTETFIVYADHQRRGLVDPRQLNPHWHVPDRPGDLAGLLTTSLSLHDIAGVVRRVAPRRPAYGELAHFLPAATGVDRSRLEANLERWRWLPRDLGSDYLLVRLAAFELDWVRSGVKQSGRRVIIGEPFRRTPSFASQITRLVVHPEWNVPTSIFKQELIPKAQQDPEILSRAGFQALRGDRPIDADQIDWSDPSQTVGLRLVQAPGGGNPLGRVKFQLPNPFSIFLHDTPSPSLFNQDGRDLSHGCVRVDGAVDLAQKILGDTPSHARFMALLESGETGTIHLAEPLPVFFIYWTVDVLDGQLRQLADIYAEDAALMAALEISTSSAHTRAWGEGFPATP
ncbi:MAG: L,D-transpeptidase family protein [Gemmatimonadetes bacterium]|nr:L,D-transpeptidase family protein [Gemmatimonadota bacterium]